MAGLMGVVNRSAFLLSGRSNPKKVKIMVKLSRALFAGVSTLALTLPVLAQTAVPQADDSYFLAAQELSLIHI